MGDLLGPDSFLLEYFLSSRELSTYREGGSHTVKLKVPSFFDELERIMSEIELVTDKETSSHSSHSSFSGTERSSASLRNWEGESILLPVS